MATVTRTRLIRVTKQAYELAMREAIRRGVTMGEAATSMMTEWEAFKVQPRLELDQDKPAADLAQGAAADAHRRHAAAGGQCAPVANLARPKPKPPAGVPGDAISWRVGDNDVVSYVCKACHGQHRAGLKCKDYEIK
jgi:hypothetical protein